MSKTGDYMIGVEEGYNPLNLDLKGSYLDPDYEEWERGNEMNIEEKDKMMEEIDDTTSNIICSKAPF